MCRQPQVKGHASDNLISVEVDIVAMNACSFNQKMSLTSVIIIIIDIIYHNNHYYYYY